YARNFLFPRKLAVLADSQAAASIEAHLKKIVKQRAIEEAEMLEVAQKINGVEITLKAKVGENDKLYGSVTTADIAESLSKAIAREIDKKRIDIIEPIRMVGVYDVIVRFTHDITAVIAVTVMSDAEGAAVPVRAPKVEAPVEEKKEKKPKKEKAPKAAKEEATATEEKPSKEDKPAKEKKAKAVKEEKPVAEESLSEDKPAAAEKKPKSKGKKTEDSAEATKE
ncbi:MAG: 50S ribosomal protein L9, partial [Dehalococcoidales bacterium]